LTRCCVTMSNANATAPRKVLLTALAESERRIENEPAAGLPAPRPYPRLAVPGVAWIKGGRYWKAYDLSSSSVIVAVFFETVNIPGRL
jgi:hypothetical protein